VRAIYVAGDESPSQIREAMKAFGLNVGHYEKKGALQVVDYRDWYLIGGEFNISRTISLWRKSLNESVARGFKGLRVAGEMGCFFRHRMINELVIYERALHRELEIPMATICAYDDTLVVEGAQEEHYLKIYLDLITAHSTILFVGPEEAGVLKVVQSRVVLCSDLPPVVRVTQTSIRMTTINKSRTYLTSHF